MEYKVYESTDDKDLIFYPTLESEFEVQAYIYWTLKSRGFDVRGEIVSVCKTCKFDLVVFSFRNPVAIIEVKKKHKKTRNDRKHLKSQTCRYTEFGAKLIVCTGMRQAVKLCEEFTI